MRYRIEMNLNYVQLKKGDNLYDNVDLEVEDCVEARYWKENGYPGNPDIDVYKRQLYLFLIQKSASFLREILTVRWCLFRKKIHDFCQHSHC